MTDSIIFAFGLVVSILVGSGLVAMIVAKNRAIEVRRRERQAVASRDGALSQS